MEDSFGLEKGSFFQDTLDGEALDTLDDKGRLGVGSTLDANHLAHGAITEKILLSGLACIENLIFLLLLII
jgi:hypothetical protein